MPSTRPQGLNPRLPAAPATPARAEREATAEANAKAVDSDDEAEARAGGFHESSYELHHGLQVSESDWPEEVTMPTPLGKR